MLTEVFEVWLATRLEMKAGRVDVRSTRVVLLKEDHSIPYLTDLAACVAATIHGGTTTRVRRITDE